MAKESPSPLSFRLSAEDRWLVETVAAYRNQSVSDFLRSVILQFANQVIATEGEDKILKALEESSSRLNDEKLEYYQRAVEHANSRWSQPSIRGEVRAARVGQHRQPESDFGDGAADV